jgi:hypothetical protein
LHARAPYRRFVTIGTTVFRPAPRCTGERYTATAGSPASAIATSSSAYS